MRSRIIFQNESFMICKPVTLEGIADFDITRRAQSARSLEEAQADLDQALSVLRILLGELLIKDDKVVESDG